MYFSSAMYFPDIINFSVSFKKPQVSLSDIIEAMVNMKKMGLLFS